MTLKFTWRDWGNPKIRNKNFGVFPSVAKAKNLLLVISLSSYVFEVWYLPLYLPDLRLY